MVTADDIKAKRVTVLLAQKALSQAQFDLQQTQVQQQIDQLTAVEPTA